MKSGIIRIAGSPDRRIAGSPDRRIAGILAALHLLPRGGESSAPLLAIGQQQALVVMGATFTLQTYGGRPRRFC